MADDKLKPDKAYQKLMKATNMTGQQMFAREPIQEIKVQIRPHKEVPLGKFKTDPLIPGGYIAHPTTIRAMRKDLFIAGSDEFLDLEDKVTCHSCSQEIDRQFWIFCPFCEALFNDF